MVLPRMNWMTRLAGRLRALGPYAAIGLVVPGGSFIAVLLWALRHRVRLVARVRQALGLTLAPASGLMQGARQLALAPASRPKSAASSHGIGPP